MWNKHWGAEIWGHLYVHGAQQDWERTVNKIVDDRAKGVLFATGHRSADAHGKVLRSKIDSIAFNHWKRPITISELRSFMGFCNYYSAYVRMYAEPSGPLHQMLQVGRFAGRKGSKEKLAWTRLAEEALKTLKRTLLGKLGLFLINPDKGFVLRTDASDYALEAVLEEVREDGFHVPVAFGSTVLAEGQRGNWTAREKEMYGIICALHKWSRHIGWRAIVACSNGQSLQIWHKQHVDTPLGPAARHAQ